jgi:hypothetical protein
MSELEADYVILGGGSAGCVLAARLSEDPATRVTSGMRIKLESAPAASATYVADAERNAYRKMLSQAAPSAPAVAVVLADPELLVQIPRLKENLRALDNEMHATATSDLEKRLAEHARILELGNKTMKYRKRERERKKGETTERDTR